MWRQKLLKHIFRFHGLLDSFRFAFKGIYYLFMYHRNMRLIFLIGTAALILGSYYKLEGMELVVLCITVTLVFMAEMFNTAIEMVMNMLTHHYEHRIRIIKDIAAGVVFIASLNSVIVGIILFARRIFR